MALQPALSRRALSAPAANGALGPQDRRLHDTESRIILPGVR